MKIFFAVITGFATGFVVGAIFDLVQALEDYRT